MVRRHSLSIRAILSTAIALLSLASIGGLGWQNRRKLA